MIRRLGTSILLPLALLACGSPVETDPIEPPPAAGCQVGDVVLPDGSCESPGVPASACGVGFVGDEADGCVAVLPSEPCPEGLMAVPGEDTCRPVAPCAAGPWGDIPVEPNTQYVDAGYQGGNSNGSDTQPWTTINDAVAAAATGSMIAVAAGTYQENVQWAGKSLRIWGVCPELVQVQAADPTDAVFTPAAGGDGSEIHTLGTRYGTTGVAVAAAQNVLIDRVWVRDTTEHGLYVTSLGSSSATVTGVLIERAQGEGVYAIASALTLEHSVIRDGIVGNHVGAAAVWIQHNPMTLKRAGVYINGCLFERNEDLGVFLAGSDMTMDATLVRDTKPRPQGDSGRGLEIIDDAATGMRPLAVINASVVERSQHGGIFLVGGDVTIDATVVRDTYPRVDQYFGRPVSMEPNPAAFSPSTLIMSRCLLERGYEVGLYVSHGSTVVTQTRIRDIVPRAVDNMGGYGVDAQDTPPGQSFFEMRDSVVERTVSGGVFVAGHGTLQNVWIHDVAATSEQLFGDGLIILNTPPVTTAGAEVIATACRFEGNARAGVASFDGALNVSESGFECNAVDLSGDGTTANFSFTDGGGNVCGCAGDEVACQIVTAGLEPPAPI